MNNIYFDNQASTPVDVQVVEMMNESVIKHFANPHSDGHAMGWESAKGVENALGIIARIFKIDPDEVVITSGATEANNLAILGYVRKSLSDKKTRIITTRIEHKSVLEVMRHLEEKHSVTVDFVNVSNQGNIELDHLEHLLSDDVLMVSLGAVNSEIGCVQDLQSISKLVKKFNVFFHTDAAQALMSIQLEQMIEYADSVSISGHKIYGPKGIGALIIKREWQSSIEPLMFGGMQQNGLRSGTLPTPLCSGFAIALENLSNEKAKYVASLRDIFVEQVLSKIEGSHLNGPQLSLRHPGNANICFKGVDGRQLLMMLQPYISASLGSACSSGVIEPSYVLREVGLSYEDANSSIRFSLGAMNTEEEVYRAVEIICEKIELLKMY
jgi:cysteine desulfurase